MKKEKSSVINFNYINIINDYCTAKHCACGR